MKIVINKCFGGFGVSIAAMKRMVGKCEHVKASDPIEYYGSKKAWKEALNDPYRDQRDYIYFDEKDWPVTDEHRHDARTCPVLVQTVEEMGEKVNDDYSKLRVIEIPDDVDYEIDEYDGIESIHEKHQVWG